MTVTAAVAVPELGYDAFATYAVPLGLTGEPLQVYVYGANPPEGDAVQVRAVFVLTVELFGEQVTERGPMTVAVPQLIGDVVYPLDVMDTFAVTEPAAAAE